MDYISRHQEEELADLVERYESNILSDGDHIPMSNLGLHEIDVGDAKPISRPPYRIPQAREEFVKQEIEKGLKTRLIRPSTSPWAFPVVVVPKQNGKLRMCINYIPLNRVTKKNAYPLPLITDILNSFKGAKFFSNIDLFSGYYQLGMDPNFIPMTAFVTKFGQFEYTRMPFGLTGATRTFQKAVNGLFKTSLATE